MAAKNGKHAAIRTLEAQPQRPKPNVLLGYLAGNQITQSFHTCLLDLIGYDLTGDHHLVSWAKVRTGPLQIVAGRNQLCEQLLKSDEEWLFMLDSDMGFAPDTLERLLAVADPKERPVVGGLCFSMREGNPDGMGGQFTFPAPTILNWTAHNDGIWRFTGQEHYPVNSMIRIGATGAACILINRSVFERIGGHWFDQIALEDGVLQGEDISFCYRLRELGIPIWMHTGVRTTHMKTVWLAESDFWQSRIAPAATDTVDVIVPALHRPQNVPTLMRSLRASTGLATATWVCEPDDREQIAAVLAEGGRVLYKPGTFAEKVNYAYSVTQQPWLLLVGDDVRFRPGWLDQALAVADWSKANVIGTNDLLNPRVLRGEHATHPLIRRSYVEDVGASWDGPGVVCHEGYRHWYVDDEIVMAAKLRGTFEAALGSHVEHLHPIGGKVEMDDVYALGASRQKQDHALFQQRLQKAIHTPVASVKVLQGAH